MSNDWMPDFETEIESGHRAVAGAAIFQALDQDGHTTYYVKYTPGLDDMTALGMMTAAVDTMRGDIQRRWRADEGE